MLKQSNKKTSAGGQHIRPEIARIIEAIARDMARRDHEREIGAENPSPPLVISAAASAD
jgi:hypothetical protein